MKADMVHQRNGQINIVLHDRQSEVKVKKEQIKRNNGLFEYIDQELSSFIGLGKLKKTVKEIYATLIINEKREQLGLAAEKQVLHMLFKGNPGTGKTTVARKLAKIYYDMNILSKGHFIEAERADLVGEYIGQTAQKTKALIQKAAGGILFIDEAYSLARGGEKDFGKEAIDTLVTHMENNKNDFVLILAGYPYEMERFLTLNPGLKSRFPFILDFEDYGVNQLMDIAKKMVSDREYQLTKEAEWTLRAYLMEKKQENEYNFANARYVRNVIEDSIRKQAIRLVCQPQILKKDLITITKEDLLFKE